MFKFTFSKVVQIAIVYILLSALMSIQFLPWLIALKLILILPFMFFLPGYLIAPLCFKTLDQAERICWGFFLSLGILYLVLHPVEVIGGQLTAHKEIITITSINIISICLALFYRWRKRTP